DGTGPGRIAAVGREAGLDGQVRIERRGLEKPRRHANGRVRRADEILDRQLLDPDGAAERRWYRADGTDHGDRGRWDGPLRLDPDRQALDGERRLRDVGHADRHVPEPHHAAELVPRGGGDRMVDRGVELAGELAPADPGDVEPRAMERDAKRFEMGRDGEPL